MLSFSIILAEYGPISYNEVLDTPTSIAIIVLFGSLCVGSIIGHAIASGSNAAPFRISVNHLLKYASFIGALAIVGGLAYLASSIASFGFSLGSMQERREMVMDQASGSASAVQLPGLISRLISYTCRITGPALIAFPALVAAYSWHSITRIRLMVYASIGLVVLISALNAGRSMLFVMLIFVVPVVLVKGPSAFISQIPPLERRLFLFGGSLFTLVYFFILPHFRSERMDRAAMIQYSMNCTIDPGFVQMSSKIGEALVFSALQAIVYSSHQAVFFQRFFHASEQMSFNGGLQFRTFDRLLGLSGADSLSNRAQVFSISEEEGMFGNVWGTMFKEAVLDFGMIGGSIQMIVFGCAFGYVRQRAIGVGDSWSQYCLGIFGGYILLGFFFAATAIDATELVLLTALGGIVVGLNRFKVVA